MFHPRGCLVLTLILTAFTLTGCGPKDPTIENPAIAVVRVDAKSSGRPNVAQGRGFFVSADGLMVTSLHVINGAQDITIIRPNGDRLFADFVQADKEADLAILRVHAKDLPFLKLNTDDPEPGLHIRLLGTNGVVNGVFDHWENMGNDLSLSIPMFPLDAGAPVIGDDGRVVGVAREPVKGNPSETIATPIMRVFKMMPALGHGSWMQ
ncbi:MAG TPA: serine protease [Tepidisphaeraceae bacterium]|jgi:serine protease Do|nr:serine protease [Tepidisphaeraceae bacterium]